MNIMRDDESQFNPKLGPIMDELLDRARCGNPPSLEEYEQKYPELADDLRDLFETLFLMEGFGKASSNNHPSNDSGDATPKRLGDFKIIREIGRGGMGIVYEAIQESLGRHVAVKVLPHSTVLTPDQVKRFQREARSAASLQHKNIVPVFGVGEENGLHYYVMQYIDGRPLDHILSDVCLLSSDHAKSKAPKSSARSRNPSSTVDVRANNDATAEFKRPTRQRFKTVSTIEPLPAPLREPTDQQPLVQSELTSGGRRKYYLQIAKIAADAAEALNYAHGEGVLHRDIKPSNLLIDENNHVWITDFGLAKSGDEDLTNTGDLIGTLRYIPPERLHGWSDPRSDVYSLGLTLYEMAALQAAFPSDDRVEVLKRVQNDEPTRPRKISPDIPIDLETVILKAISKEPQRRYSSGARFADDLNRFIEGKPVLARRSTFIKRFQLWCRRQPIVAGLCFAVICLLITVAVASTMFATQLKFQLGEVTAANEKSELRLFDSFLSQARSSRFSTEPGRRKDGLEAITNATRLKPAKSPAQKERLRNELIACLSLDDIQVEVLNPSNLEADQIDVDFDAENTIFAHLNLENQLEVADVASGAPLRTLGTYQFQRIYTKLQISPCGTRVAVSGQTTSNEPKLILWDIETGERVVDQELNWGTGMPVCFSDDGKLVAFANEFNNLVMDAQTGELLYTAEARQLAQSLEFLPGNQLLVNGLVGYEIFDGAERIHEQWFNSGHMRSTAVVSTGQFAFSDDQGTIHIAPIESLYSESNTDWSGVTATCQGHFIDTGHLSFHPTRPFLISTGHDAKSRIWDSNSGQEIIASDQRGIHFSQTGDSIGCSNKRAGFGRLKFVASRACVQLRSHNNVMGSIISLAFDHKSKFLLTVSRHPNELTLWDMETGQRLESLKVDALIRSVVFDPNHPDQFLMTKTRDITEGSRGGVELCQIVETKGEHGTRNCQIKRLKEVKIDGYFHHTVFVNSGRQILIGVEQGDVIELQTWTWPELERVRSVDRYQWMEYLSSSPDGKFAAFSGHAVNWFSVSNLDTGEEVLIKQLNGDLGEMETGARTSFSVDGQWLAVSEATKITLYSTETWQPMATIPRSGQGIGDVAFSRDNEYLAVAHLNHVGLYQVGSFEELAKLQTAVPQQISGVGLNENPSLVFDSSSRYLAVGTTGNSTQVWDLQLIREKLRELRLDW